MSQEIDKTKPVYARFKVVNGVPHYVLCIDPLVDTHIFSFELNDWTDKVTMSNVYIHLETLLVKAFAAGFKQVIEVVADQTTDDSIRYIVKRYTEEEGIENPVYLFTGDSKKSNWSFLCSWYRTQSEALIAVNSLFPFAEVEPTEKSTEVNIPPIKTKKAKKKRPPSVMRAFKKEVIQTIKQRRLTCISLAEETSIHEILRDGHVREAKKYEAQLRKLGARFPKWKYSWER